MPNNLLAFSHPGKMGDALYTLPTIKALCERENKKADFYTSDYCRPMRRLFEHQPYINKFIVPENYAIENFGCGGQPWQMPIPDGYDGVYQLGFRTTPNKSIPEFIAESAGLAFTDINPITYTHQNLKFFDFPYIVIATRGRTTYDDTFRDIMDHSPIKIVQTGSHIDFLYHPNCIDMTGVDLLETLSLIAGSVGFVGIGSGPLVLANGFPNIPKVCMHDNISWCMPHFVFSPSNFYPVLPSYAEVLSIIDTFNANKV